VATVNPGESESLQRPKKLLQQLLEGSDKKLDEVDLEHQWKEVKMVVWVS
jgi:hypothetical protein